MKKLLLLSLLLITYTTIAQNSGIGINATGSNPDPSAGLDVNFIDKGVLLPRLTENQRDAIQNPAIGLQLFNTTTNCLQIYMPISGWQDVACDCQTPPSASFTFVDNSALNSNVIFNASTQGLNYSWIFQNGTPATSNQVSPTVTWANSGIYFVSLTVTDNIGCSTTSTDSITIVNCQPFSNNPITFNYVDSVQTWIVPPGICTIQIQCFGSQGGSQGGALGGLGGSASGSLSVSNGDTLYIYVGGKGVDNASCNINGGFNGGGSTGNNCCSNSGGLAGSGGGASDIRINGTTLQDRIIVAGGGGGGGSGNCGGAGGGLTGQNGCGDYNGIGATGGSQSSGGLAGGHYTSHTCNQATVGVLGVGGIGDGNDGGGGGGGYYGGGGGANNSGGAGGSGYIGGVTNGTMQVGVQSGNGQIIITY